MVRTDDLRIDAAGVPLEGTLTVPDDARAVVVFAHGSGSSRHSPRNRFVAQVLRGGGLGTLLMDLLTPEEDEMDRATATLRFDIGLLAERVAGAVRWARRELEGAGVGLFGASTGAAAALVAAAEAPDDVGAVVSRGGRPDLAGDALPRVRAATLLLVGSLDAQVLELNEQALAQLSAERELHVIEGASHLFEEPGTLEQVAEHARDWFVDHLATARR